MSPGDGRSTLQFLSVLGPFGLPLRVPASGLLAGWGPLLGRPGPYPVPAFPGSPHPGEGGLLHHVWSSRTLGPGRRGD